MTGQGHVEFAIGGRRVTATIGCKDHFNGRRKLIALAAVGCGLLFGITTTAHAGEAAAPTSMIYSSLRSYVQQINADESLPASVGKTGDVIAALRGFAQQLPNEQPTLLKSGPFKVAEANSLLQFLEQNNSSKPSAKPAPKPAPVRRPGPVVQAHYVGSKVCLGCHSSQMKLFEHTLMGRLFKQGKMQCETCHGPGSEHVRLGGGRGVGGIISFRPNDTSRTAEQDNAICLGCHERGDRTLWQGSIHQTRRLYCTNCHTIMKRISRRNQLKTAWQPDTCFQCHKDRRAQMFESAHMPMRPDEGKVVCSDCHNPHGSYTKALLRGDSINDVCYKCHAEKRGPFLWEHSPVRENCLNCHNPHGSVNQYMLKMSRPRLCFQCHGFGHGQTNGPGAAFTMNRACQNCHTAIHGSNSPAGFYFQR